MPPSPVLISSIKGMQIIQGILKTIWSNCLIIWLGCGTQSGRYLPKDTQFVSAKVQIRAPGFLIRGSILLTLWPSTQVNKQP